MGDVIGHITKQNAAVWCSSCSCSQACSCCGLLHASDYGCCCLQWRAEQYTAMRNVATSRIWVCLSIPCCTLVRPIKVDDQKQSRWKLFTGFTYTVDITVVNLFLSKAAVVRLTCLGYTSAVAGCFRFCMVSYCGNTRRIGVGAKNGSLAVYDLKQSKCQVLSILFQVWVACASCSGTALFLGAISGCYWHQKWHKGSNTLCKKTVPLIPKDTVIEQEKPKRKHLIEL